MNGDKRMVGSHLE